MSTKRNNKASADWAMEDVESIASESESESEDEAWSESDERQALRGKGEAKGKSNTVSVPRATALLANDRITCASSICATCRPQS